MLTLPIQITQEVIDAINGELAYVASLHAKGRADDRDHGVEGQLVTLKVYTDEALVAWAKSSGDDPAQPVQHALRKVAAIAIRALLLYGCPKRPQPMSVGEVFAAAREHDARLKQITEAQERQFENGADANGYLSR